MKHFFIVLVLIATGWTVRAQSAGNPSTDTAGWRPSKHSWNHNGKGDSLNKRNFRFDENRGETRNRFGDQGGQGMDRHGSFSHRHHFDRGVAGIHFSPEQRKQWMDINKEYHKKQTDLYKNDNLTLGQYKSQLLVLQKEKKGKWQTLLTPQQKSQMEAWKKRKEENAQVMAAAHLERMKIRLDLTDAQAATIKNQQQNTRAQIKSIRENDNLMRDQKMEQIKALLAKEKDAMKSVLTPEQQSKLEELKKQHSDRFNRWSS
jgi:hypothetical protein